MHRRIFVAGIAAVMAAPLVGEAQARTVYRVGYLAVGFRGAVPHLVEAFREGLLEAGYVEPHNLVIEFRYAEGKNERVRELAVELVRLGVDAIFAPGEAEVDALKQSTDMIPVVFSGVTNPVERHLVVSFGRPGRNMTGLTLAGTQLTEKRLSLLKEAVPQLSRIAVLWNPTARTEHLPISHSAGRALGLQPQTFKAHTPEECDVAFDAIAKARAGAVILLPDVMIYQARERLGRLGLRYRLPMVGWRGDFAHAGALLGYGASLTGDYRRAGVLVGKILSGAKPADIPVEEPSKFEFVINLKTARTLGLTIPPSLLLRADQVIE